MKYSIKLLKRSIFVFLVVALIPMIGHAQDDKQSGKAAIVYKYNQYVMVTLKDGTEVPARVSSVKSKNQYYVRMIGGNKTGLVNKRFMRAMSSAELDRLRESNKVRGR